MNEILIVVLRWKQNEEVISLLLSLLLQRRAAVQHTIHRALCILNIMMREDLMV
jgi:hypothetical protein